MTFARPIATVFGILIGYAITVLSAGPAVRGASRMLITGQLHWGDFQRALLLFLLGLTLAVTSSLAFT